MAKKRTSTKAKAPATNGKPSRRASTPTTPRSVDGCTYRLIHRSLLLPDPANPRTIDPYAHKSLGDSLRTHKLLPGVVWNSRTGHIISGHQRIAALDKQYPDRNYELTVGVIDVDLPTQRAINVKLNNPELAGLYDVDKLDLLIRSNELDIHAAGMSLAFLEGEYLAAGLDVPEYVVPLTSDPSVAVQMAGSVGELLDEADAVRLAEKESLKGAQGGDAGATDGPSPSSSTSTSNPPGADHFRARREEADSRSAWDHQAYFHATFVFPSNQHRDEFLAAACGFDDLSAQSYDGMKLAFLMGFEFVLAGGGQRSVDDGGLDDV